jgi:hypothetical protein
MISESPSNGCSNDNDLCFFLPKQKETQKHRTQTTIQRPAMLLAANGPGGFELLTLDFSNASSGRSKHLSSMAVQSKGEQGKCTTSFSCPGASL